MSLLYTPYRYGSHCWAFDCAVGRLSGFDSPHNAEKAAKKQKSDDLAECRDSSRKGMLTWAMRVKLDTYPPGMSAADNPFAETPSETAVV